MDLYEQWAKLDDNAVSIKGILRYPTKKWKTSFLKQRQIMVDVRINKLIQVAQRVKYNLATYFIQMTKMASDGMRQTSFKEIHDDHNLQIEERHGMPVRRMNHHCGQILIIPMKVKINDWVHRNLLISAMPWWQHLLEQTSVCAVLFSDGVISGLD